MSSKNGKFVQQRRPTILALVMRCAREQFATSVAWIDNIKCKHEHGLDCNSREVSTDTTYICELPPATVSASKLDSGHFGRLILLQ